MSYKKVSPPRKDYVDPPNPLDATIPCAPGEANIDGTLVRFEQKTVDVYKGMCSKDGEYWARFERETFWLPKKGGVT